MTICDEGWYKTDALQELEALNVTAVWFYFTFVETQTKKKSLRTQQKEKKG